MILLVLVFNFSSEETPVVDSAPAAKTEKNTDEPSKQVNDKAKTNKK
jgi:hypothetical protein